MKILVTGGAGFIGSHLCEYLVNNNHEVTIIDNLILGEERFIEGLYSKGLTFYNEDLNNTPKIKEIFSRHQFEAVFHLAANSDIGQSFQNPDIDFDNTSKTTYSILKHMKEHGVKQIIFASTSAIYGETSENITEFLGPLMPVSHYGAAKLASEAWICSFAANYGIKAWIPRFPNVVGENATHGVVLAFVQKLLRNPERLEILGDGMQIKPYIYVKELVLAIAYIWEHSSDQINIFNIGTDSRTQVNEIAKIVAEEMNITPEFSYTGGDRGWVGDVPEFKYDLTKIKNLGWQAKLTSDEAVRTAAKKIIEQLR
jgi:UDP-glucose 4-epimerase